MKLWGKHQIRSNRENHRVNNIFSKVISFITHSATIRMKLIVAFLVPIAFIIFLGFASFGKAEQGIRNSYEKATRQAINMSARYLQLGTESIEALSTQYIHDENMTKYFQNYYSDDDIKLRDLKQSISKSVSAKEITDNFISDISVFSNRVDTISTISKVQVSD
jgi:methyl-accepting chemotaxis protein